MFQLFFPFHSFNLNANYLPTFLTFLIYLILELIQVLDLTIFPRNFHQDFKFLKNIKNSKLQRGKV